MAKCKGQNSRMIDGERLRQKQGRSGAVIYEYARKLWKKGLPRRHEDTKVHKGLQKGPVSFCNLESWCLSGRKNNYRIRLKYQSLKFPNLLASLRLVPGTMNGRLKRSRSSGFDSAQPPKCSNFSVNLRALRFSVVFSLLIQS